MLAWPRRPIQHHARTHPNRDEAMPCQLHADAQATGAAAIAWFLMTARTGRYPPGRRAPRRPAGFEGYATMATLAAARDLAGYSWDIQMVQSLHLIVAE